MRKRPVPCGLIIGLAFVGVLLCGAVLLVVLFKLGRFVESLPTPRPSPVLEVGKTYWIGAILPPPGLPAGLTLYYVDIQNKPRSSLNDPGITVIGVLKDATPVKLTGIQDKWCYIEATNEFGDPVEGWLDCDQLLDYQPTPFPTPDLTPVKP